MAQLTSAATHFASSQQWNEVRVAAGALLRLHDATLLRAGGAPAARPPGPPGHLPYLKLPIKSTPRGDRAEHRLAAKAAPDTHGATGATCGRGRRGALPYYRLCEWSPPRTQLRDGSSRRLPLVATHFDFNPRSMSKGGCPWTSLLPITIRYEKVKNLLYVYVSELEDKWYCALKPDQTTDHIKTKVQ
ncbi:hypothetical protein EVAR_79405_1 [Eumeta japonica]|uniref:Uncharacterized protein n=1 Tax=Eumeta variegata TaxID=151549 RepID=A0A4C1VGK7_EUMVA|nr:hypothetical protein EVAR_79405_1 [Eumeta japonica]